MLFQPSHPVTPKVRGFTLVELLIVIGIIALLIAIILPALTKAQASARNAQCLSNQRQVFTAVTMFAGERGKGYAPGAANPNVDPVSGYGTGAGQLIPASDNIPDIGPTIPDSMMVTYGYLRNRKGFRCPEMDANKEFISIKMQTLANIPAPWQYSYHYSYNEKFVGQGFNTTTFVGLRPAPWTVYKMHQAKPSATMVFIADMYSPVEWLRADTTTNAAITIPAGTWTYALRVSPFHNRRNKVIVTYADGHGEMIDAFKGTNLELGYNWKWIPTSDLRP